MQDEPMKTMKKMPALCPAVLLSLPFAAIAQDIDDEKLEEITVLGRSISMETATITVEEELVMDSSAVLRQLPGSDVNSNGRITGIAQYRGMYGDRVAVTVDGLGMISGGPNAMDTPLSYVSPMITEELILERGIPGVASAPESVGGRIDTQLARGTFESGESFGINGNIGSRYSGNGDSSTTAGRFTTANDRHKFSLVAEADRANDISTPEGDIVPSGLTRNRGDLSYAYHGDSSQFLVFGGLLDTTDSGTPALAMDIRVIDTKVYGTQFRSDLTENADIGLRLSYNDVDHLMDNFTLRPAPGSPMQYRQNHATGDGINFDLTSKIEMAAGSVRVGVDGKQANHDSVISNPEYAMFEIRNFTDVKRDITGAYAVWQTATDGSGWEVGLRYNHVETNAGLVGARGMMGMMGSAAQALADEFNSSARDKSFANFDAVAKYRRPMGNSVELSIEAGSKSRAPSYQELYLWLPLQATGGLADGRNYIGNLDLKAERSNEINVGVNWFGDRFSLSPQVFYKDVSNYIQGVSSTNVPANMLAMMMSGNPALQFTNVDAEIYGLDLGWEFRMTETMYLDGYATYARGRRTDVTDNLYRLAPLNGSLAFNYATESWRAKAELVAYAGQYDVAAFNAEQTTTGYGVVNASVAWHPTDNLRLEAQLDNLLDRSYQNHLTGVNRVAGVPIPQGERLYGPGRTLTLGAILNF